MTVRFPIALFWMLPFSKPMQAMLHVPNLVVIDFVEDVSGCDIVDLPKPLREMQTVVEIGLFEGETQSGYEIQRAFHGLYHTPKMATEWIASKFNAALAHPFEIEPRVLLFFL